MRTLVVVTKSGHVARFRHDSQVCASHIGTYLEAANDSSDYIVISLAIFRMDAIEGMYIEDEKED